MSVRNQLLLLFALGLNEVFSIRGEVLWNVVHGQWTLRVSNAQLKTWRLASGAY